MRKLQLKTMLLTLLLAVVGGVSPAWAGAGDVIKNADIDFSNAITGTSPYTITGTVGSMTWTQQWTVTPYINDGGVLCFGNATQEVILQNNTIENKDIVTISFEMGFGRLNNKYVGFKLLDADGNELLVQQFDAYNSDFDDKNPLGLNWANMYHAQNNPNNTYERRTYFTIAINYATRKINTSTTSYLSGTSKAATNANYETDWTATSAIAKFVLYGNINNTDRYHTFDNLLITTTKGDYTVATADYTVKYVDGEGNTIKDDATYTGDVNADATVSSNDKATFISGEKKYIYVSDDSEGKTIANDGSTVVTVTFREAATWNYTVKSSLGGTLATGSAFEQDNSATVSYPQYILDGTTLYKAADSQLSGGYYQGTFAVTEDNLVKTINYAAQDLTNVVFYTEAEDVEGATVRSDNNADIRCSMGKGASFASDTKLTTLPAGIYKIHGQVWGSSNQVWAITANNDTVWTITTTGYLVGGTGDEFTLTEETDIIISAQSNNRPLDLVYIQKTGDYDPNVGEHYIYSAVDSKFLSRGADYGARAIADNYGVPANVVKNGDVYNIQFLDNELYLGSDGYADKASNYDNVAWTIEETDGGFKLKNGNSSYAKITDGNVNIDGTAETATVWSFKTIDEQKAIVAATQQANIVSVATAYGWDGVTTTDAFTAKVADELIAQDQTALIKSTTAGNIEDWTYTQTQATGLYNGYNTGDYGAELFRRSGYVSQTITVPEAGIYKLTLNALYREGSNAICQTLGAKGYDMSNAYVSINDTYFARIPDWYSEADGVNPDNTTQAKTAFEAGKYAITVYAYVGNEKELTIKLHQPNWVDACWMLFNNFALTYYAEPAGIAVESVSLDKTSATIALGDAPLTLTATVLPADADDKNIVWTSSDETVATVANGVVTALNAGTATITATSAADDTKKATCEVTVTQAAAPSFYSEIAAGDFYIMNVATGKFLGGANSWGTQASLIEHGIPFTSATVSEGVYTLDSHTYNNANNHFLNGTYVDGAATNLYITSLGSGKYSISTADGSAFVSAKGGTTVVDNTAANANSALAQWYFISKNNRDKMLAAATAENPVDATYYIKEANISRNLRVNYGVSGWTNINYGSDGNQKNENYTAEVYNGNADIYQTIENIPNGTYTARVQGFTSGSVKFYANDVEVNMLANSESIGKQSTAAQRFLDGAFVNELTVTVTDRTLKIGLKGDCTSSKWLVYDNFELYLTSYAPVTDITATIDKSEIMVTKTAQITSTVTPAAASFNAPVYTSSNEAVATVDANGVVTGVSSGTATITVAGEMETSVTTTVDITVTYDLSTLYANLQTANALNAKVTNGVSALASAISAAQAVYDAPENQDAIDAAATTLGAAITAAEPVVTARLQLAGVAKKADALKDFIDTNITTDITAAREYALNAEATADEANAKADALNANFSSWEVVAINNGGFDTEADWQTGNVAAVSSANSKNVNKWTSNGGAAWSSSAAFAYSGNGQINGAAVPSTDMYGQSVGGMLGFSLGWNGTIKYTQTVDLPVGKYVLYYEAYNGNTEKATIANNLIGLKGTNSTATDFGTNTWNAYATNIITVNSAATGAELTVGGTANDKGSANSAKFVIDNVTIYKIEGAATESDYAALNAAIEDKDGKTLGFDEGEYAPYNNAAVLQALAAAKAINQNADNFESVVTTATANLTAATWTANTEEVNAIYDGTFASEYSHSGNVMPIGWHGVGNHDNATDVRLMWNSSSNAGLNATSSNQAAFAKFTAIYGNETGYTMPLKAGVYYSLSFIFGGWNENATRELRIYNNDNNATFLSPTTITAKDNQAHKTVDSWSEYNGLFTVPVDGDYILSFYRSNTSSQNQICFSDIEIKRAVAENITIAENADFTPALKYANVTLNRTIKAENTWNTFCVPFDITNSELKAAFGDDVQVAEYAETAEGDNSTVSFNTMETPAITANKPVLLKTSTAKTADDDIVFEGRLIKTGDAVVTGTNYDFVGSYDAQTLFAAGDYYLSQNKLYKSIGKGSYIQGTRAYIKAKGTSSARIISFSIDDEEQTTGIEDTTAKTAVRTADVYNLNGQKMEKQSLRKGLYIQNGRKVVKK